MLPTTRTELIATSVSDLLSHYPGASRSRKATDTGLVHRVACPFTPQLLLVLINRSRKDGTLSWRWYIAATGRIRSLDLVVASPAPYHMATAYLIYGTVLYYDIVRQWLCRNIRILVQKRQAKCV